MSCDITTILYKKSLKPYDFKDFLVRPTRFERATYRVGVCHSIQLSYERIFYCLYSITDTRRKVKQKNGGLHFEGKLVQ